MYVHVCIYLQYVLHCSSNIHIAIRIHCTCVYTYILLHSDVVYVVYMHVIRTYLRISQRDR